MSSAAILLQRDRACAGMTSICPHRHTSYAAWRLQVIRQLCLDEHHPASRTAIGSVNTKRGCRDFSDRLTKETLHHGSTKRSTRRYSSSSRAPSTRHKVYKIPPRTSSSERGNPESLDQQQDDARVWNPRASKSSQQLKDMIAELEDLTQKAKSERKLEDNRFTRVRRTPYALHYETEESPLERRLASRRLPPKKKQTWEDIDVRLSNNTWAKMLASPLRLCVGTKARLPKDLMSSWGLVRHPQNQQDYLMPVELSDVRVLGEQMLTEKDRYRVIDGVQVPIKLPTAKPPEGQRIQLQTNKVLTRLMTNNIMKSSRGKQKTSSMILSGTLIPHHWKEKMDELVAFKRTQKTVDPITGTVVMANDDWKKQIPDFRLLQWQPDIHDRIQTIMIERLLVVLKGVAANNTTSKAIRARKVLAMDLPKNGRLVLASGNKLLPNSSEHPTPETDVAPQSDSPAFTQWIHTWGEDDNKYNLSHNFEDDQSSPPDSQIPSWAHGGIFLHIGTAAEYVATVESWHAPNKSQEPPSPYSTSSTSHQSLLPPMVSIHSDDSTINLPIFNIHSLTGPHTSTSPIAHRIDATIHDYSILDYRFWASHDETNRLRILEKQTMRDPPSPDPSSFTPISSQPTLNPKPESATDAETHWPTRLKYDQQYLQNDRHSVEPIQQRKEYVVLVKGTAAKSRELIEEIWRLWRYRGGREGAWQGEEDHEAVEGEGTGEAKDGEKAADGA